MSYANVFELTKCLKDCLEYCRQHPDREHAQFHKSLILDAQKELDKSTDKADREFVEWRMESRDDRLAWKHLAAKLAAVQRELDAVNAIGYLDQKVMYWNQEHLLAAVAEMIKYLRDRADSIDFADDAADKLERQRDKALSEDDESDRALDEYLRFSKLRSDGLTKAKATIANFRKTLRRDLSTRDKDYQAIRWPQQVSPDERVL